MEYVLVFIIFLTMFIVSYFILIFIFQKKLKIEKRINDIKEFKSSNYSNVDKNTFTERILLPIYKSIINYFIKITPKGKLANFNEKLEKAGLSKNNDGEKWLFKKNMLSILLAFIMGIISYVLDSNIIIALIFVVLFMFLVNFSFNFYVLRKIENRKKNILKDLPFTIDLITVSVEAGLSFDGAMARVISNLKGDLCDEFSKSLKEIKMGIERKIALRNLSNRCEVKELSMLVTSIIQADELGVSLGKVLRIEASNLREHRKQVAREKAMKAPIKLLFPLILFIFPSIFVIILGPAVIKIIDIFM
ncbi:MAG: type II secretion system F family protein [Clostridiaceae bacterium]